MEQAAACCRIRKVGSLCRRGACCCPIKVVKKPVIAMAVCGSAGNDRLFCFCCVRFPTPPSRKPPAEPAGCNTAVYRSPGRCRVPRCPVPAAEPQGSASAPLPRVPASATPRPRRCNRRSTAPTVRGIPAARPRLQVLFPVAPEHRPQRKTAAHG